MRQPSTSLELPRPLRSLPLSCRRPQRRRSLMLLSLAAVETIRSQRIARVAATLECTMATAFDVA